MNVDLQPIAAPNGQHCRTCTARAGAICASLDMDELDSFSHLGRHRRIARGQRLTWEGDRSLVVGNVIEGAVKLSLSTPDGREQIVGIAWASDFIGRPYRDTISFSATALTESRVCVFGREDFEAFVDSHPEMAGELLRRTLGDLERARSFMLLLARQSAGQRVATFLLELAARTGSGAQGRVNLPLQRQDIADVLGLTIETVSRQLTRLARGGVIDLPDRGSFAIRRQDRLEALAA